MKIYTYYNVKVIPG